MYWTPETSCNLFTVAPWPQTRKLEMMLASGIPNKLVHYLAENSARSPFWHLSNLVTMCREGRPVDNRIPVLLISMRRRPLSLCAGYFSVWVSPSSKCSQWSPRRKTECASEVWPNPPFGRPRTGSLRSDYRRLVSRSGRLLSAQHVWLGGIFDNFKPPSGYLHDCRNPKPVEILTVSQVRDAVFHS